MLNNWLDQSLRSAQPVLIVVSCLCLCLGSCFPSSEPLNRIAPQLPTVAQTVRSTSSSHNVFTSYVRNMETVLKNRLTASGQIFSTNSPLINSTIESDNSLPSKNSRRRQRPTSLRKNNHKSTTRDQTNVEATHRNPKRRKLPSDKTTKTKHGLDARAGKRRHRNRSVNTGIDCTRILGKLNRLRQLENSISMFLAVYPDGVVNGTSNKRNIHTLLSFVAYRHGLFRIYGEAAMRYVCMSKRNGHVYTDANPSFECIFNEQDRITLMNTYSLHSPGSDIEWYLGINKKGVVKNGRRVRAHVKIAQFLPLPPPDDITC